MNRVPQRGGTVQPHYRMKHLSPGVAPTAEIHSISPGFYVGRDIAEWRPKSGVRETSEITAQPFLSRGLRG